MTEPETVDALSALAPLFRVRPELQTLCLFGPQWSSPHVPEAAGWAPFHLVTRGRCILDVPGEKPVELSAGDILLLPHGDGHIIRGPKTPVGEISPVPVTIRHNPVLRVVANTDQPETELVCGRLTFEQAQVSLARAALPPVLLLKTANDPAVARLGELLLAIRDELTGAGPGARAISTDLASALLVMALRIHVQRNAVQDGLLRLLTHRQAARAVNAMIDDPARDWSLDEIASLAGASRATLVRDFRRLAGVAPLSFLAELRLGTARHLLATTDRPLIDIALEVGYQSQSALSRAFQRQFNLPPSALRQAKG